MKIKSRSESIFDIPGIEALIGGAFLNASHTSHTEHFIVNALSEAGKLSVSLVAENNGEIVGHVSVSPVSFSDGSDQWYGVGPHIGCSGNPRPRNWLEEPPRPVMKNVRLPGGDHA